METLITAFGPPDRQLAEAAFQAGADRFAVTVETGNAQQAVLRLQGLLREKDVWIAVPPLWEGDLFEVVALARHNDLSMALSTQVLRACPLSSTDVMGIPRLALVAEAIYYDEEVWLESELQQHAQLGASETYVPIGVGTDEPLPQQLEENLKFPDWDYLSMESIVRIAEREKVHWGGNLPLGQPEWMAPVFGPHSAGFFVVSSSAFGAGSPNHIDFHTLPPSEIPGAVGALRKLSDAVTET